MKTSKCVSVFRLVLYVLISVSVLYSCSSDGPGEEDNNPRQDISLSRGQEEVVNSQNDFAFRLFAKAIDNSNRVISPLSVSMAMSMTANGTAGGTYNEICNALGFDGANIDEVNSLNGTLIECLPVADKKTKLYIANSIWIDKSFPVYDEFVSSVSDSYDATVENIDMYSQNCVNRINKWVSDKTSGRIGNIISKPLRGQVALVNAIYFKSLWRVPFKKKDTKIQKFHNETGGTVRVNMMNSGASHFGFIYDDATVARIDYGNNTFQFTAIMPPENVPLCDFVKTVNGAMWQEWNSIFDDHFSEDLKCIEIGLPKFKTESEFDLIPTLRELGINKAFIMNEADLSKLTDIPTAHILSAFQKATIEVDEDGAVAAVTTVSNPGDLIADVVIADGKVVFDRPFIYVISERSTGAILFMGNVSNLPNEI